MLPARIFRNEKYQKKAGHCICRFKNVCFDADFHGSGTWERWIKSSESPLPGRRKGISQGTDFLLRFSAIELSALFIRVCGISGRLHFHRSSPSKGSAGPATESAKNPQI